MEATLQEIILVLDAKIEALRESQKGKGFLAECIIDREIFYLQQAKKIVSSKHLKQTIMSTENQKTDVSCNEKIAELVDAIMKSTTKKQYQAIMKTWQQIVDEKNDTK